MSSGCNADSCTKCIDQTDSSNFYSCEWNNQGKYCFNWYDDSSSNGVQTKLGCPSVYSWVIVAVVIGIIILFSLLIWQRRRQQRTNNMIMNNGNGSVGYPALLNNNNQPNVIVANPSYKYNQNISQSQVQPVQYIQPQQIIQPQPVQQIKYIQPQQQPQGYVAEAPFYQNNINNNAPPAYNQVYGEQPNDEQNEGGYTNQ